MLTLDQLKKARGSTALKGPRRRIGSGTKDASHCSLVGGASSQSLALRMISLIDDDDGVREATASLLRSLGYEVHTFESGRAFLDWIDLDGDISCVITDIMMPDIDGFELHRRLVGGGYRFPIIFLTALTDAVAKTRMMECRVYGVLTKPCSEQTLVDCVESALAYARQLPAGRPAP